MHIRRSIHVVFPIRAPLAQKKLNGNRRTSKMISLDELVKDRRSEVSQALLNIGQGAVTEARKAHS